MKELSCFKDYDIRGEIGVNIDENIVFLIGHAVAQHFNAKSIVVGFDARESSPRFAANAAQGIIEAGADVLDIGMAGTEEMYWAVTEFGACAGIEITASHNPINYNGIKIIKSGSQPLDDQNDFQKIKRLAETKDWKVAKRNGEIYDFSSKARSKYVDRVLSFVDPAQMDRLKIVTNSGNGSAGPTIDAIMARLQELGVPIEFINEHHEPDSSFPNGIPNPLIPQNRSATADIVLRNGADMGVAFDGDFDRCFLFDHTGRFVPGEYVVGLLASIFLDKEPGSKIVHDPRVIWNTQDIVTKKGGFAIQSKTGHAFIKQTMRKQQAIYGGEMSAHHYFRDFAYCDSGMIPWLMVAELVSKSGRSLSDWVSDRFNAFPSSGETNFRVNNTKASIDRVLQSYRKNALSLDETDGVSLTFADWRFNLRCSSTENLIRLNIEGRGCSEVLASKLADISEMLNEPNV